MKKTQGQKRESTTRNITIASFFILAIIGHVGIHLLFGNFYSSPVFSLIVLAFSSFGSKFVSDTLSIFYVRESDSKLNEGFYTDNSWLNVENGVLVLMDEQSMSIARFNDQQTKRITLAFQANASHEKLAALFEKTKITRILFSNITSISSRHDDNVIHIEAGPIIKTEIEFLNSRTKVHAMERLERVLPATLNKTKTHRSRLISAMPRLVVLGILGAVCVLLPDPVIWGVVGLVALVFVIPKLVRRLLDPTVVTEYTSEVVGDEESAQDANKERIAA